MIIYSKFENLNIEKQRKIVEYSLKEFADNGFDRGSTNMIVEDAGISKGSLFNYFKSKKGLYIYILDYSMKIIENMYEEIDLTERDIFKRLENIGMQKVNIYQEFPYVFDFLSSVQLEESQEVKDLTQKRVGLIYEKGIKKIYENIDHSMFREDIDTEKAIEILNWTMFGVGEKNIKKMKTFKNSNNFRKELTKEWKIYSEMLRKVFYK